MDVNPDLVIYFDSEEMIESHHKEEENQQLGKKEEAADGNQDDLSARVAQADPNSEFNKNL